MTAVKIPTTWRSVEGMKKKNIPYEKSYGKLDLDSVPDYVIRIKSFKRRITLYSDAGAVIPENSYLIFKNT